MNLRRLLSIIVKELRQLRRDKLTFAMIVGIPTMQLLLFGYAINLDIRNLDAAVLDQAYRKTEGLGDRRCREAAIHDALHQAEAVEAAHLLERCHAVAGRRFLHRCALCRHWVHIHIKALPRQAVALTCPPCRLPPPCACRPPNAPASASAAPPAA